MTLPPMVLSSVLLSAGLLSSGLLTGCGLGYSPDKNLLRIEGPVHFVDGYPAISEDGLVNVVVEIPSGTLAKWEVDKNDGSLAWQFEDGAPRVVRFLGYPGNYGMVPRTYLPKSEGGDGDPLDVLVLGDALERGSLLPVRLIGVLEMLDRGEQDDKLIAVALGTPFEKITSIDELDEGFPGASEIIRTWFESYKGPGKIKAEGFSGPDRALEILEAAKSAYAEARIALAAAPPSRL